jgi:hypothetical protein
VLQLQETLERHSPVGRKSIVAGHEQFAAGADLGLDSLNVELILVQLREQPGLSVQVTSAGRRYGIDAGHCAGVGNRGSGFGVQNSGFSKRTCRLQVTSDQ